MAMLEINGYATTPSEMTWGLYDVSSSETGRTLDALMHKDVVAQKRTLSLQWNGVRPAEASAILKAVNSDVFFSVKYPDPMSGNPETRTFYVGDRTAPYKLWTTDNKIYSSISFELIER